MKRDVRIESFRCLCMFGVCLLHALDQGGYADSHRGLDNLCTPSVVGFLFISGYFGIQLSLRRVVKLLGIGFYCAFIVAVGCNRLSEVWFFFRNAWFLWCYLALMLLSPILNYPFTFPRTVENRQQVIRLVVPVLILVFFWSYLATKVPILKVYVPEVGGFGAFGVLTFAGVYLAAQACRYFEVERHLSLRHLVIIAIFSGVACWMGLMHYHSPFALLFAGSVFYLFKKMPVSLFQKSMMSKLIYFMAPSTFSIYLIHNTPLGLGWMKGVEDHWIGTMGLNYYLVCFAVAVVFFMGGLILDLPRRFVLWFCNRKK